MPYYVNIPVRGEHSSLPRTAAELAFRLTPLTDYRTFAFATLPRPGTVYPAFTRPLRCWLFAHAYNLPKLPLLPGYCDDYKPGDVTVALYLVGLLLPFRRGEGIPTHVLITTIPVIMT